MRQLAAAAMIAAIPAGCTGNEQLAASVTTINREAARLQDQELLLNILRRSRDQPARFTSLSIIRGRNRASGGVRLRLPFGAEAPSRFVFEPDLNIDAGPSFEVSPLNNQEFLRGLLAPVGIAALEAPLREARTREVLLAVTVAQIRLRDGDGERSFRNDPEDPAAYAAFRRVLDDLLEQGLATERVELVHEVSPVFRGSAPLPMSDLVAADRAGLVLEPVDGGGTAARQFRLRRVTPSLRFCFLLPRTALMRMARCGTIPVGSARRMAPADPQAFGAPGMAVAVFDGKETGRIEVELRSLAAVLDFLGALVRVQRAGGLPGTESHAPLLVVREGRSTEDAIAAIAYEGRHYAIPGGPAGGASGITFALTARLVAQAQSVRDLPASNAVTIVGE